MFMKRYEQTYLYNSLAQVDRGVDAVCGTTSRLRIRRLSPVGLRVRFRCSAQALLSPGSVAAPLAAHGLVLGPPASATPPARRRAPLRRPLCAAAYGGPAAWRYATHRAAIRGKSGNQ